MIPLALFTVGIAVLGGYFVLMSRYAQATAPSQQRQYLVLFVLGLGLELAGFLPSPQWFGNNYRFLANMLEFLLITSIAPPLLLLGLPKPFRERLTASGAWHGYLLAPQHAFLGANALFLGWHLPPAFEAASADLHLWLVKETVLLFAGLWVWLPILGSLQPWSRIGFLGQILYMFLLSIPTTILGALFTFAPGLVYNARSLAFELCAPASPLDQQLGGLLMWQGTMFVNLGALSIIFFKWHQTADAAHV